MATDIMVEKVFGLQICNDETNMDVLTEIINNMRYCGTTAGWVLTKRPECAPIECEARDGFTHYVFDS